MNQITPDDAMENIYIYCPPHNCHCTDKQCNNEKQCKIVSLNPEEQQILDEVMELPPNVPEYAKPGKNNQAPSEQLTPEEIVKKQLNNDPLLHAEVMEICATDINRMVERGCAKLEARVQQLEGENKLWEESHHADTRLLNEKYARIKELERENASEVANSSELFMETMILNRKITDYAEELKLNQLKRKEQQATIEKLMGLLESLYYSSAMYMYKHMYPDMHISDIQSKIQDDWQSYRQEHGLNPLEKSPEIKSPE